ncbi:DUF2254 domain-containing protein [Microbulbifer sp. SAOS-129_SWC]|uniref:DUF2254 domain-containing protein n=1 Tax=Microbulbifer sp. SAOS-129_SWC TaxID=3145235 RepID=UPI003216B588
MKQRLQHIGERLRASFWLIPAVMVFAAIVLAQALLYLDRSGVLSNLPGLSLRDPNSARSLLSTIAASTITVAGTVFSITTVALSLASSQFGPRLVRNFMRDRGTQFAMGMFLSTFVYALMTIRGIDALSDGGDSHVAGIHAAVLLALISIGTLIYFIHNVAQSIQVDNVTFNINREFSNAIDRHYPAARHGHENAEFCDLRQLALGDNALNVFSGGSGYILSIDRNKLVAWAREHGCCILLDCHAGSYVHHWSRVARIYQPPRTIDSAEISTAINQTINIDRLPTAEQDIVFSIHQLAQIAVRALSPGINDPYTAYSCIDRLVDGIGKVLQRPQLPNCFHDDDGELRLVTTVLDFDDLLRAAFDEIREYGRSSGVVMHHLLNNLIELADICSRRVDKRALDNYSYRLEEDCDKFIKDRYDRELIGKKIHCIRQRVARR